MTTKASPPVQHSGTGTSGVSITATSSSSVNLTTVKIKKEIPSDEIKDFAETAMNELLGWYGYDNVDRLDLSKASRLMIASLQNSNNNNNNNINNNSNNNNDHKSNNNNRNNQNEILNGSQSNSIREDSTTPDHDSSREDDSKSPCSTKTSEKLEITCGWCHRIIPDSSPEFLRAPEGPRYCTEACFAQSRRASFKRAKQCDWCRHVRHAVSYVDFQDGATRLQFCSDKCLNQYKMQIFCKETQAHLDMNPHLKEKGCDATSSANLITPDLWLKNCRSRSASPQTEGGSRSPTPTTSAITVTPVANLNNGSQINLKADILRVTGVQQHQQSQQQKQNHKPIISVAPVSKLMSKQQPISSANSSISTNRQSLKHSSRKKRNTRLQNQNSASNNSSNSNCINSSNSNNMNNNNNNNIVNNGNCNNNNINNNHSLLSPNNNSNINKSKILLNSLNQTDRLAQQQQISSTFPNVQDLRLNVPPISPIDRSQSAQSHHSTQSQHQQQQQQQIPQIRPNFPPHAYFASANNNFAQLPPRLTFPPHHLSLPPPHLRSGIHPPPHPSLQNLLQHPHEALINPLTSLLGGAPPVTVMVPYPVIIPLPIPIPIPLPITDFIKAAALKKTKDVKPDSLPDPQQSSAHLDSSMLVPIVDVPEDENEEVEPQISKSPDSLEILIQNPSRDHDFIRASDSDTSSEHDVPISKLQDTDETSITNLDEPLDFTKAKISNFDVISRQKTKFAQNSNEINDGDETETVVQQILVDDDNLHMDENAKQKVPKFKITRLHTKRINNNNNNGKNNENNNVVVSAIVSPISGPSLSVSKESLEFSRPLRKRKRIIDCDYNVRNPKDDDNIENSASPKLKK